MRSVFRPVGGLILALVSVRAVLAAGLTPTTRLGRVCTSETNGGLKARDKGIVPGKGNATLPYDGRLFGALQDPLTETL